MTGLERTSIHGPVGDLAGRLVDQHDPSLVADDPAGRVEQVAVGKDVEAGVVDAAGAQPVGHGDLSARDLDWNGPGAIVTITRINDQDDDD